ncbi:hypothetical protein L1987_65499 [Smallanthus sonchifolius]|uniref:Uncharacterized protein n=1 Tax=Smallanthus sonchifolius TaxID=185202 RepID=A0ACB9BUP9_9ASTR|nr:hypothetical protein L1987_65499 [Smallanthus sonchifolius]
MLLHKSQNTDHILLSISLYRYTTSLFKVSFISHLSVLVFEVAVTSNRIIFAQHHMVTTILYYYKKQKLNGCQVMT